MEISLTRTLPALMVDYHVWSDRLHGEIALADWDEKHARLDEEEMELGIGMDEEILDEDPVVTETPIDDTKEERTEKLDGAALVTELTRLRDKSVNGSLSDQEKRWLDWLELADAHDSVSLAALACL